MKPLPKEILDEMTRRLVENLRPERIILFGSHAWGEPDEDSDVDLLVIVRHSDLPPAKRAMHAHRCLRGLGVSKDVIVKTVAEVDRERRVHASLVSEALERGRPLYG
jgi:predicted nucleotidyltransferase